MNYAFDGGILHSVPDYDTAYLYLIDTDNALHRLKAAYFGHRRVDTCTGIELTPDQLAILRFGGICRRSREPFLAKPRLKHQRADQRLPDPF